jgi:hypothetical protein
MLFPMTNAFSASAGVKKVGSMAGRKKYISSHIFTEFSPAPPAAAAEIVDVVVATPTVLRSVRPKRALLLIPDFDPMKNSRYVSCSSPCNTHLI